MTVDYIIPFLIAIGSTLAIISKKIDLLGGLVGAIVTWLLYVSIGSSGIIFIGVFFLVGTLASIYQIHRKEEMGVAEKKGSKRGWKNVLANSGVAAFIAVASIVLSDFKDASFLIATCFSVALSDTLSSEMGNVTGRKYFNIISLRASERGSDGVVSWVGFLWGILGSCLIGLIYWLVSESATKSMLVTFLGFGGNLIDSLLGATLQRKGYLDNHFVNFISILFATIIALVIIGY